MSLNCTPVIYNNTITRNRCTSSSSSASGAGVTAYSGSSISGANNIIVGNVATSNPQVNGSINFNYSCCPQALSGTNNITSNPMLVNTPPTGYCFLSQVAAGQGTDSPCVDAGNPNHPMIDGYTRSDGVFDTGVLDMGFHWQNEFADIAGFFGQEYETGSADALPTLPDLVVANYPNPFNPVTTLRLSLPVSGNLTFIVSDISGREVQTLHEGYLNSGIHEFDFVGENLPSGIYFYKATIDGYSAVGKALLIK